jgi:hypothetical protein
MRMDAAMLAAAGLVACAATLVEAQAISPPRQLCPDDPRTSTDRPLHNEAKRTVGDILAISAAAVDVGYRSPDWSGSDAIRERVQAILDSRPRLLSSFLNWSEGANLSREAFVATLRTDGGSAVRVDVAGYQVCIRDAAGRHWYLRTVPGDQWP